MLSGPAEAMAGNLSDSKGKNPYTYVMYEDITEYDFAGFGLPGHAT